MTKSPAVEPDEVIGPASFPEDDFKKPLLEHLEELRWRSLRCFLWVGIGTAFAFSHAKGILAWLIRPVGTVVF